MRLALAEERAGLLGENGSKWQAFTDTKSVDFCVRPGCEISAPPFVSVSLSNCINHSNAGFEFQFCHLGQ